MMCLICIVIINSSKFILKLRTVYCVFYVAVFILVCSKNFVLEFSSIN